MNCRRYEYEESIAGETVLIYPSAGGRPKARRMTTELTADQHDLSEIFELGKRAPQS